MNSWVRKTLSREHQVALIEGGYHAKGTEPMPGYYSIICRCGWTDKSYFGEQLAQEKAERHIFSALMEIEKMAPSGRTIK